MAMLANYQQFEGLHWETGPLRNALDYQGFTAPHTGEPLTEALLFGISGGVVAGYFVFEYEGHDPWLHFLTRNSFDPMPTIIDRLGIETTVKGTTSAEKAIVNLTGALEAGKPALVWADAASLPYNNQSPQPDNWFMLPVLVYGSENDTVHVADRAHVPLTVAAATLALARARVKKDRQRIMMIDSLDLDRLPAAVEAGIDECIRNMTEAPSRKPMTGKFGLVAYQRWADLLVDRKSKQGWAKQFAPGPRLYAGLKMPVHYMNFWDAGGPVSRQQYADFLHEAAVILGKPALNEVAQQFRAAASLWQQLNARLLPDDVPAFKQTRELMQHDYDLFMTQGAESLPERRDIKQRLDMLENDMATNFPLDDNEAATLRDSLREVILQIHDAEGAALNDLKAAMG